MKVNKKPIIKTIIYIEVLHFTQSASKDFIRHKTGKFIKHLTTNSNLAVYLL